MLAPSPSARPSKEVRRIRADILDRARRAAEAGKKISYELKDADKEVVHTCVPLLRLGRPTPFSLEGLLTALIRADRCASGWSYLYADASARAIVTRALQIVGARRPLNTDEGKRWYSQIGRACMECGGDLSDSGSRYFCDDHCAMIARGKLLRREEAWETTWYREASRALVQKLKAPMAKCANPKCDNAVHLNPRNDSRDNAGTFCSRECAAEGRRDRVPERICENPACGEPFRPHTRNSDQRWCSQKCAGARQVKRREERVCARDGCDNRFYQTTLSPNKRFCSHVCANARHMKAAA